MIKNKKIALILPAYNAEKTLLKTYNEIPLNIIDEVILVDDYSTDKTVEIAKKIGIKNIILHEKNKGYGANQKTCYNKALELNVDIIVMLHPDYQYPPKLIEPMCFLICNGIYDVVIGSRILGKGAIIGGMPIYKYFFNRLLTLIQNLLMNQKLSEYHTGYRAFSSKVLNDIQFNNNDNNFIFDNQILSQIIYKNYKIGEISCPTNYDPETSSITFYNSIIYGFGVLITSLKYFLMKKINIKFSIFNEKK